MGQAGDTARLCGNTHSSGRQQQEPKWGRLEILPSFVEILTLQVGSRNSCEAGLSQAGDTSQLCGKEIPTLQVGSIRAQVGKTGDTSQP